MSKSELKQQYAESETDYFEPALDYYPPISEILFPSKPFPENNQENNPSSSIVPLFNQIPDLALDEIYSYCPKSCFNLSVTYKNLYNMLLTSNIIKDYRQSLYYGLQESRRKLMKSQADRIRYAITSEGKLAYDSSNSKIWEIFSIHLNNGQNNQKGKLNPRNGSQTSQQLSSLVEAPVHTSNTPNTQTVSVFMSLPKSIFSESLFHFLEVTDVGVFSNVSSSIRQIVNDDETFLKRKGIYRSMLVKNSKNIKSKKDKKRSKLGVKKDVRVRGKCS